jgi:hypothetical protein
VIIRRKNLKRFSLSKEYCEANKERPYFEIAKELGCCVFTVFKAMKKHKISKKRACNISVEDYQSYLDGVLSEDDLKVKYDFPIKTIRLALRRIEK